MIIPADHWKPQTAFCHLFVAALSIPVLPLARTEVWLPSLPHLAWPGLTHQECVHGAEVWQMLVPVSDINPGSCASWREAERARVPGSRAGVNHAAEQQLQV